MSTVVACARDGHIWMAADTQTNIYNRPMYSAQKIHRYRIGGHETLIGVTGNGALSGLISSLTNPDVVPDFPADKLPQFAYKVATAITKAAMDLGVVDDGTLDGALLLGCRGQLWTIFHAQAIHHPDGRAALGSGEGPAIGALDALLDLADWEPAAAVQRAVEIAMNRDRHTGGVVQTEHLPAETSI